MRVCMCDSVLKPHWWSLSFLNSVDKVGYKTYAAAIDAK